MKKSILYILVFFSFAVSAQEKDKAMDQANEEYAESKFVDAEANYRISNSKFNKRTVSPYNLGNAIYKQNQIEEAKYAYAKAIEKSKSTTQKHKIFHNLGNVFMKEKNYSEAVEAYKNALRNNPADEETRYNFALAKKMLKENPPKDDKNNNPPPSEYAKMMKAKADKALENNKFNEAFDIMSEALRNDATTKYYQDYISKIEDIVKIIKQ